MADNKRRGRFGKGSDETSSQSIFDLFEPPPEQDSSSFGKIPVIRDDEELDLTDIDFADAQRAAEAEAAGLRHWTEPATGKLPASLAAEEHDRWSEVKGPSWQGEEPNWAGPDLSDVFADTDAIRHDRVRRPERSAGASAGTSADPSPTGESNALPSARSASKDRSSPMGDAADADLFEDLLSDPGLRRPADRRPPSKTSLATPSAPGRPGTHATPMPPPPGGAPKVPAAPVSKAPQRIAPPAQAAPGQLQGRDPQPRQRVPLDQPTPARRGSILGGEPAEEGATTQVPVTPPPGPGRGRDDVAPTPAGRPAPTSRAADRGTDLGQTQHPTPRGLVPPSALPPTQTSPPTRSQQAIPPPAPTAREALARQAATRDTAPRGGAALARDTAASGRATVAPPAPVARQPMSGDADPVDPRSWRPAPVPAAPVARRGGHQQQGPDGFERQPAPGPGGQPSPAMDPMQTQTLTQTPMPPTLDRGGRDRGVSLDRAPMPDAFPAPGPADQRTGLLREMSVDEALGDMEPADGYDDYEYEEEYEQYEDGFEDEADEGGRSLVQSSLVGVALAAVVFTVLYFGPIPTMVMIGLLTLLAVMEVFNGMRVARLRPATLLGLVGAVALPAAAFIRGESAYPLVIGLAVVFGMLWYLTGADTERPVLNLGLTLTGVLWIGGLAGFGALMVREDGGTGLLAGTIIITATSDSLAYIGGRAYGSRPFHHASPNKTWEGTVTGFFGALFAGLVIGVIPAQFGVFEGEFVSVMALAAVVGILAPIGDLAESLVKRDLGLKDMGTLLPGHGGVMDRVDGLLFALPGAYYVAVIYQLF